MSVLEKLPQGSRVAIIRLRSMGDCVLTTPAIQVLKQARPDLRIAVVVERQFADVFRGLEEIETILPPEFKQLRRWKPRLAINFHGGRRSRWLTRFSKAKYRAGFVHFRGWLSYNVRIPSAQKILGEDRKVHTAEHLASAMFHLGVPRCEIPRAKLAAPPRRHTEPYAVIHPFASAADKTWPAQRFSELAAHIRKELHLEPVFIGGPNDSLVPFFPFRTVVGAPLETLKSLIAGAHLFVGNDSGPAHIAAAFGAPLMVFFGSSDVDVWRPWQAQAEVLTSEAGINGIFTGDAIRALERLGVRA